ncbi:hypothetical protein A5893_13755 [Pedobacter psychrophilus]|uniref:Uncharacterized protein n=1 Tax=Pedobacter psychrophilus TaxID=1826909 RepID=A0A179DBR3_9SPHI|nr:hypothetical protein [Pedobacter psychrophilus]OAQ38486.1 hypothetical protein A5893_13755 [Pedobacter psychrophilus]
MMRLSFVLLLFILFACQNKSANVLKDEINIAVSKDSSSLIISNIDDYILRDLSTDTLSNSMWAQTIAVYSKTDDEDLQDLEKPIIGKYAIADKNIVFTPNLSFKKGKSYLVELYLQNPSGDITENLKKNSSLFNQDAIQKTIQF